MEHQVAFTLAVTDMEQVKEWLLNEWTAEQVTNKQIVPIEAESALRVTLTGPEESLKLSLKEIFTSESVSALISRPEDDKLIWTVAKEPLACSSETASPCPTEQVHATMPHQQESPQMTATTDLAKSATTQNPINSNSNRVAATSPTGCLGDVPTLLARKMAQAQPAAAPIPTLLTSQAGLFPVDLSLSNLCLPSGGLTLPRQNELSAMPDLSNLMQLSSMLQQQQQQQHQHQQEQQNYMLSQVHMMNAAQQSGTPGSGLLPSLTMQPDLFNPHHAAAHSQQSMLSLANCGITLEELQTITITPMPNPSVLPQMGMVPSVQVSGLQMVEGDGGVGPQYSCTLTISNDLVGCIIGKKGCTINAIRKLPTVANIKIGNLENGSKDRKITLIGQPERINKAILIIQHILYLHQQIWQYNLQLASTMSAAMTSGDALQIRAAIEQAEKMEQTTEISAALAHQHALLQQVVRQHHGGQQQQANAAALAVASLAAAQNATINNLLMNNTTAQLLLAGHGGSTGGNHHHPHHHHPQQQQQQQHHHHQQQFVPSSTGLFAAAAAAAAAANGSLVAQQQGLHEAAAAASFDLKFRRSLANVPKFQPY